MHMYVYLGQWQKGKGDHSTCTGSGPCCDGRGRIFASLLLLAIAAIAKQSW